MEKKQLWLIIGGIVILLLGVVLFWWLQREDEVEEPTDDPTEEKRTLAINEDGFRLEDETYDEVIIEKELGEGSVELVNVDITTLIIRGGGKETINIENSRIEKIISEREDDLGVRILFVGNNEIGELEIRYYTILESGDESNDIKTITVNSLVADKLTILELREIKATLLEIKTETELVKMGETIITETIDRTRVTVEFDTDGGSAIEPVKVKIGETIEKPTNPTKDGYNFIEWQLNDETFDFTRSITENITLKAIYEQRATGTPTPRPTPSPTPTPTPTETYTYTTEFMVGSPDVIIRVFRNGTKVTASEVLTADNIVLGVMTDIGEITVTSSAVPAIAKARLANGTIVELD